MAVAWSGGADSTALLLLLKQCGFCVQAWHVDHAWRETSAAEAEQLVEQAKAWGIPVRVARLDAPTGRNREAESRQGRYTQFEQWAQLTGIHALCLGHHQDDQAETVCMRLLQGAGVAGCRGMQSRREHGSLTIVRPLLALPSAILKTALREAGIGWLEDPSNLDLTVWRNHIRQRLFPAIAHAHGSPSTLFLRWQVQAEQLTGQLDAAADSLLAASLGWSGDDYDASLPWTLWAGCSAPLRARLLQKMMVKVLKQGATPGRRHILMVEAWTLRGGRGGLDLSRCRLQRKRKHLHLRRTSAGFVT
ncbi:MAG: tRNA lysidine(34) synthetase TilS [Mariprofundus sp.]